MRIGIGLGVNRVGGVGMTRSAFVARITAICGQAPVAGFLPQLTDTTTTTCPWSGKTWTADATMTGQLTACGNGAERAFVSASSRYLTTPDTNDLSFGNGATDSPFSLVALANVTNTAGARALLSKRNAADNREWNFFITTTDGLQLSIVDESAVASTNRISDGAISQGAYRVFAATYDGRGGATAGDGITLYQNASVIASTATNPPTYVAMEPLAAAVDLGSQSAHTAAFFDGGIAFGIAVGKVLSAANIAAILAACQAYFGVPN